MKNKSRILILSLALATALAFSLTGCGDKLNKQKETETETEKMTEPPTEKVTEPPTEKETEPPTEKITETETEEDKELTPEEEKASETELKGNKTMYAADDINVRMEPDTTSDSNIISSYDQGEEVIVTAETKHWYKVQKDDYSGYVHKDGLSETAVEPKSPEERQETMGGTASSTVDLEYDVRSYAESFPLVLSADANVRSKPSEEGNVVTTISNGTNVTALGETDRWYKIEYDGVTGYVNKNLVK